MSTRPEECDRCTPAKPCAHRKPEPEEVLALYACYLQLLDTSESGPFPASWFASKGISDNYVHWLLYFGHMTHLTCVIGKKRGEVKFIPADSLLIRESSHFLITDEGTKFGQELTVKLATEGEKQNAFRMIITGRLTPSYDAGEHVLSWGCYVLKRFLKESANQKTVLTVAQELEWPLWFDDPLVHTLGINPKVRAHDTAKDLNRWQKKRLIHFKTRFGTQFGWELR